MTVFTQAMYQMLDTGFVGLIFSTFNEARTSPLHAARRPALLRTAVASPAY